MSGNILNVARREFSTLIGNKLIVIILLAYVLIAVINIYSNYMSTSNLTGSTYLSYLLVYLTDYGSLVALAIGFFMISDEKRNHTINTLLVKPLYRDTVINGKFVGAGVFLFLLMSVTILLYTSGLFIAFGGQFGAVITDYCSGLPVIMGFSLLYILVFFLISVLLSILVKEDIFALFSSLLIWFLFLDIVPNVLFAGNISILLTGGFSYESSQISNFISLFSPAMIRTKMILESPDLIAFASSNYSGVGTLLLYVIVLTVLNYVVFLGRDIS